MDTKRLEEILSEGEKLNIEFKSERRREYSDKEIYEETIALANTIGGTLLIGVENNGTVTGARPRHGLTIDPNKLRSAIFHNTRPNVNTRISVVPHEHGLVIAIEVESYPTICATAGGKTLHRIIGSDGKPATAPMYPHEHLSRKVDLGLLDFSSQPVENATFDDLNPLEFERVRQTIDKLHGDRTLLELSNEELAKALRLVESSNGRLIPNIAGLLIFGRVPSLEKLTPTHVVHFQVIDERGDVRVNDAFKEPLVKIIDEIESRFKARNEEREKIVGLFRYPIPDYSLEGFREAINNALIHRDYTRMDNVYVQWYVDRIIITNPGGFLAGITAENILVHEPKPRNPRLAESFKRIGITEQTGRGVDRIYMGQVRYGRPLPDYSLSDNAAVRMVLPGGESSLDFATFIFEEERNGKVFSLDDLLIMNQLYYDRRIDPNKAGRLIQKGSVEARRTLERLHELGLVDGRGEKGGRIYHLSSSLYKRFHMESEYVRTKGFESIQQEYMVIEYVKENGEIRRSGVMDLCRITEAQAKHLLRRLREKYPEFQKEGEKRAARYKWIEPINNSKP